MQPPDAPPLILPKPAQHMEVGFSEGGLCTKRRMKFTSHIVANKGGEQNVCEVNITVFDVLIIRRLFICLFIFYKG